MKKQKKNVGRMPMEMALCSQRNRVFKGMVEKRERDQKRTFRREVGLYV